MVKRSFLTLVIAVLALMQGCTTQSKKDSGSKKSDAPEKGPAHVENRVEESNLTRIKLTPEAEQRLGLAVTEAVQAHTKSAITIAGEFMLIPGESLSPVAPVSGTIHLIRPLNAGQSVVKGESLFKLTPILNPQRDLRVSYEADVEAAKARLDNASRQLERAQQLLHDLAGSQKNVDAAEQEFTQAKAAYEAAVQRLQRLKTNPIEADVDMIIAAPGSGIVRQVHVSEGQTVSSGAVLIDVADYSRLWLRVPVYAGDADSISGNTVVTIRNIDGVGPERKATRVPGLPTADPAAVTKDIYFEVLNPDRRLSPGQRMVITLASDRSGIMGLRLPATSLVYDNQGGTWVYVVEAPHTYRRQRVEVIQNDGKSLIVTRGIVAGTKVVTDGAAELFGTEFGAGK